MTPKTELLRAEQTPQAERDQIPSRRKRTSLLPDGLITLLIAVALISANEAAVSYGLVSPLVLPRPSDIASALWDGLVVTGKYREHALSTIWVSIAGFLIAAVVGIGAAAALSVSRRIESISYPFILAFQTLPKVAIAPLVIIWFGFSVTSKLTIVVICCFFPILVNSLQGLRLRDPQQYELLRSLGASKWQLLKFLRLYAAVPYIFAGLRIGLIFSLIGAVVAEFVGSRPGLGYVLLIERGLINTPGVFAILVILMVIGLILNAGMTVIERRVAFWARDLTDTAV